MSRPDAPEIRGCGDGGCIFGPPGEVHTNGGCSCLRGIRDLHERLRITRNIEALRGEVERLRAANLDALSALGQELQPEHYRPRRV